MRKFEIVEKYKDKSINLPKRSTKNSAGYDIEAAEDIKLPVFTNGCKPTLIPTGIKVCCEEDECVLLLNRSSGPKKGLVLANSIGLIDSDYYNNESNEGELFFAFYNISDEILEIKKGDRIGQAVFTKFLITDDDNASGSRTGGFGSTN